MEIQKEEKWIRKKCQFVKKTEKDTQESVFISF